MKRWAILGRRHLYDIEFRSRHPRRVPVEPLTEPPAALRSPPAVDFANRSPFGPSQMSSYSDDVFEDLLRSLEAEPFFLGFRWRR
jgi:hypothetical protein